MIRPNTSTTTTSPNSQPAAAHSAGGFLPAVPLLALDRQYAVLRDEIRGALDRVCDSGKFVLGPDVHDLEAELARSLRVPHVISCASGSDALLLALMALDIKPGDEVILPSYTFFATASAVTRLGAVPIFADIDPITYLVDPADVKKKISTRTKAIVPVHLFGRTADMDAILPVAKAAGIPVVEDAAMAAAPERSATSAASASIPRKISAVLAMVAFSPLPATTSRRSSNSCAFTAWSRGITIRSWASTVASTRFRPQCSA
jgi:DNA-binding transcriptional MocR family regulator